MVVFEVIGRLRQRLVRAFMIAAEWNRWTSMSPNRGLALYNEHEIVRVWLSRQETLGLGPAKLSLVQSKRMEQCGELPGDSRSGTPGAFGLGNFPAPLLKRK